MSGPRHFWLLVGVGLLDLLLGLALSIFVGLKISLLMAGVVALSFFISANTFFYLAYRKLR